MHLVPFALACLSLLAAGCSRSDRKLIQNMGSETMVEVAQAWAEEYRKVRPDVGIAVAGGGSQSGIAGIINGAVDLANCSRPLKPEEIETAKKAGRNPVQHLVGYDGLAIYVHPKNGIASITLEQLKEIYIENGSVTKWSQLGVQMPGNDDVIVPINRPSSSGTYEYFRDEVLGGKTNFRMGLVNANGAKDVVENVGNSVAAIGYSGLAAGTNEVRMVPVVDRKTGKPVAPSIDTVLDKTYPIARPLFMYTVGEPAGPVKDYLEWIKSDAGQRVLLAKGYPPLRKL